MDQDKPNWWEHFFQGIALDFWRAVVSEEQTRAEADFIQAKLEFSGEAKVLDVPCGNGRISLELASRGFQLTGVDIAAEFIEEARAGSAKLRLNIEWLNRDMRDLPWREQFEGALCFGNSFGYLDDEGNADFLKAVSRSLKPAGRFIIDTGALAESVLPNFQERRWFEFGNITLLINSRYDYDQSRIFTEYGFIRDGRIDKRPSSQRLYTYNELSHLLGDANFEIVGAYSSLSGESFKLGSQRLLLVCAKK